jgi:phenylacetate-coenzyme A ligase PaaK-like adenylate-forming protein
MRSALRHFKTGITLRTHPRVTRERILQYQIQQLSRLVVHAYDNVPYYRRLFDRHKLKPHDIRSLADLQAIPVTGKNDLRSLPEEDIIARGIDFRQLLAFRTGGSSGEPFTIRRTPLEQRLLRALRVRAMKDMGLLLEVLKDGSPAAEGERGELLGTNLHAHAMPLMSLLGCRVLPHPDKELNAFSRRSKPSLRSSWPRA